MWVPLNFVQFSTFPSQFFPTIKQGKYVYLLSISFPSFSLFPKSPQSNTMVKSVRLFKTCHYQKPNYKLNIWSMITLSNLFISCYFPLPHSIRISFSFLFVQGVRVTPCLVGGWGEERGRDMGAQLPRIEHNPLSSGSTAAKAHRLLHLV